MAYSPVDFLQSAFSKGRSPRRVRHNSGIPWSKASTRNLASADVQLGWQTGLQADLKIDLKKLAQKLRENICPPTA